MRARLLVLLLAGDAHGGGSAFPSMRGTPWTLGRNPHALHQVKSTAARSERDVAVSVIRDRHHSRYSSQFQDNYLAKI